MHAIDALLNDRYKQHLLFLNEHDKSYELNDNLQTLQLSPSLVLVTFVNYTPASESDDEGDFRQDEWLFVLQSGSWRPLLLTVLSDESESIDPETNRLPVQPGLAPLSGPELHAAVDLILNERKWTAKSAAAHTLSPSCLYSQHPFATNEDRSLREHLASRGLSFADASPDENKPFISIQIAKVRDVPGLLYAKISWGAAPLAVRWMDIWIQDGKILLSNLTGMS